MTFTSFKIIISLFLWSCATCSYSQDDSSHFKRIATGIYLDTLKNEVDLVLNGNDLPVAYRSLVFTPICSSEDCLPIHIELHWKLNGEFNAFSFVKGEILTKTDHVPFTEEDYRLLHKILIHQKSPFNKMSKEELTGDQPRVDGVTGATNTELHGEYVPQALYTSYTLWHLSNDIRNQLKQHTINHLIEQYGPKYFIEHPEFGCLKPAVEKMAKGHADTAAYVPLLLVMIDTANLQIAQTAIELLPVTRISDPEVESTLCNFYRKGENRQLVLSKWENAELGSNAQKTLSEKLGDNFSTFTKELDLLDAQKNWYESTYYALLEKIMNTHHMMRKEKMMSVLDKRRDEFSNKFHRHYKKTLNLN
ncbi:MAG: hypothetical protein WDZ35_12305 [Crocinitomicaceae bacterium]